MIEKKHLVIGLGEVGLALQEVFECDGEDPVKNIKATSDRYDVLHIAFPYSDTFIQSVKEYSYKYAAQYVVIHSTVPIGTSRQCHALHSPIRGVHPHLAESIRTFKKFVGGLESPEVAEIFKDFGIDCYCTGEQENTEALKLWDTTQYGALILLNKEIKRFCDQHELDFAVVYVLANETYNQGYQAMYRPEVLRPYLEYRKEPIGGHCVIPNAMLLDSPTARKILSDNKKLQEGSMI